jgi:hypothetical protein
MLIELRRLHEPRHCVLHYTLLPPEHRLRVRVERAL